MYIYIHTYTYLYMYTYIYLSSPPSFKSKRPSLPPSFKKVTTCMYIYISIFLLLSLPTPIFSLASDGRRPVHCKRPPQRSQYRLKTTLFLPGYGSLIRLSLCLFPFMSLPLSLSSSPCTLSSREFYIPKTARPSFPPPAWHSMLYYLLHSVVYCTSCIV